ncbi:MAG: type II toxin-antitoxin system VapC family toxin [Acidimicrobiia bacterium]|nr:type II toxin-antitoxin system VapC family toxin [Acidimicrobiia bacterium]
MKTRVLDSWAVLEWMSGRQPAAGLVATLLNNAEEGHTCLYISAVNVGEVYYFLRQNHSAPLAESWRDSSATLPVIIDIPAIDDIWSAAILKSRFPIAYVDAFAAALAQKHRCPLVTGDPEFRRVDGLELDWISAP